MLRLDTPMPLAGRLFDGLPAPNSWRLVSRSLGSEAAPVSDPRHAAWSAANAHRHAYRELLVCIEGEGLYGYHDELYPCRPGTLILFDSHEPHDLGYPAWVPTVLHLWFTVLPDRVFARLVEAGGGREGLGVSQTWALPADRLRLSVDREWNQLAATAQLPVEAARLRFVAIVSWVVAAMAEQEASPPLPDEPPLAQVAVDAVCQHLRETAGRGASLEALARMAGYSKYHFLRLFKEHTGVTVLGFIDRCRSARAAELASRGYTHAAIAEALGFSSPASYSRWRRKQAIE